MKQTIGTEQATNILLDDQYAGWTYAGARALVEYLEQYEDETGTDIELDTVALRCDYSEYSSAIEAFKQYQKDFSELNIDWLDAEQAENAELLEEKAIEWLQEHTTVIPFEGQRLKKDGNGFGGLMGEQYRGVIIQNF